MANVLNSVAGTRRITLQGRRGTEIGVSGFCVTVVEGPDLGATAPLSASSICIGTDATNDLILTDPATSRRHAILKSTPSGPSLEDLASTNGTMINGVRVQSAFVPNRGRIQIGANVLTVVDQPGKFVVFPSEAPSFESMLGKSEPMREVFALVQQLAQTDLPVAITGETGCGKELIARALHTAGHRRSKSFQVLDCGSVVADLLRSEIFGHERGAFTGADAVRKGILEQAAGGTVLFDEIGEMGLALQPHLLRALETREISRLGSQQKIPVDFRIVSATNKDLGELARRGQFREDLFYRLSCISVRLPALRERPGDIPLLAHHFLERCAERLATPAPVLSDDALEHLRTLRWPGNVRQLRNAMEALTVICRGGTIGPADVDRVVPRSLAPAPAYADESLEDAERRVIEKSLVSCQGNRKAAAKKLGISATTLLAKLRRYGLDGNEPAS